MIHRLIIIGGGPAGLTAALYAARAELKPVLIEGAEAGGQLMLTTDVENYPGFPKGIMGPDLMKSFREQAKRFGADIITNDAKQVDFKTNPFQVLVGDDQYQAKTIIIATGASTKWLGLESETKLRGRGVSSCATCDGAFFKNKKIVVVGGGDSAVEEALFLTKFASSVTIIHRRDQLRASKIMQQRAFDNDKIDFIWDTEVIEILGQNKVEGVKLKNKKTGQESEFACEGVFVAIGHTPNTDIFKNQIDLDDKGYVKAQDFTKTNIPGVFVAGDVYDHRYRQAVTAAGFGCMAAIDVEKYLSS